MDSLKIKITRASDDRYAVSTCVDGGNWWGVGVTFPMWVGAHAVAAMMINAVRMQSAQTKITTEIIDETA